MRLSFPALRSNASLRGTSWRSATGGAALAAGLWFVLSAQPALGITVQAELIGLNQVRAMLPDLDGIDDLTGQAQRIAVIDSGIQFDHPNLAGRVVGGINYAANAPWGSTLPASYTDRHGHGTFVSGVAASNRAGSPGIAPEVELVSVRVAASDGTGSFTDIAAGLEWVAANASLYNITAVNISLGSTTLYESPAAVQDWSTNNRIKAALTALEAADVVTIAASGNNGSITSLTLPAILDQLLAVGASSNNDKIPSFTNRNGYLDLLAAGVGLDSLWKNSGYAVGSGTSYAAPVVTGAAVLLREVYSQFTDDLSGPYASFQDRFVALLQSTGREIFDAKSGLTFDRIDIAAAVAALYAEYNTSIPEPASIAVFAAGVAVLTHRRNCWRSRR